MFGRNSINNKLEEIYLQNNRMKKITDMRMLRGLKTLHLQNYQLEVVRTSELSRLKRLRNLNLRSNFIQRIEQKAFFYLKELAVLNLDYNYLTDLGTGLFNGLDYMTSQCRRQ